MGSQSRYVHAHTLSCPRTPQTCALCLCTHTHVPSVRRHIHVSLRPCTHQTSTHTPDMSMQTYMRTVRAHTAGMCPVCAHTPDVSMQTCSCTSSRTVCTYIPMHTSMQTHSGALCPCTNSHRRALHPCTRTHTHTPSVCAHTHVLPLSQVPRAALHSGSQEAAARADSPFPQAHGVTLVHMHAVRCYLCNHISTPPQILPYKDIGSRCCMLFMAFHTHMHSTEPRGCFSCTHIRFFPIKKQTHTPQNTSKCWALAPHGCSGGPLGLRAPRFWGGSSQEAQADGQTSFSSMWGHCRRSLYSCLLHAQLPREQGSPLGWGSDCSVPSLVLPSTPPPTTTTHC